MLSDPVVKRHFGEGTTILVGTADAGGMPACCRAVGLLSQAKDAVTVYLPVATAAQTVANLATNSRIAIASSFQVDHCTIQIKGKSRAVRLARDGERPSVETWLQRFTQSVTSLGLPCGAALALTHWPAFAVEVDIEAVYDQTPGPRAGALVKQR
jgi:hypothetical protein